MKIERRVGTHNVDLELLRQAPPPSPHTSFVTAHPAPCTEQVFQSTHKPTWRKYCTFTRQALSLGDRNTTDGLITGASVPFS